MHCTSPAFECITVYLRMRLTYEQTNKRQMLILSILAHQIPQDERYVVIREEKVYVPSRPSPGTKRTINALIKHIHTQQSRKMKTDTHLVNKLLLSQGGNLSIHLHAKP